MDGGFFATPNEWPYLSSPQTKWPAKGTRKINDFTRGFVRHKSYI